MAAHSLDVARRDESALPIQHAANNAHGCGTTLERLRTVALQTKASYEAINAAANERDEELGSTGLTMGELLEAAIKQCEWVVAASHGHAAMATQQPAVASAVVAAPPPAVARADGDEDTPNWLFCAAMHLDRTVGAAPRDSPVAAPHLQDAPTQLRGTPAAPAVQRARRTRKTGD